MRIMITTLLCTSMILLHSVRAQYSKIEYHNGAPYGLRVGNTTYPFGTFTFEAGELKFLDPPVYLIEEDLIKRNGIRIAKTIGRSFFKIRPSGRFVYKGGQPVQVRPVRGDILIRRGLRYAVYENGFRTLDRQLPDDDSLKQ